MPSVRGPLASDDFGNTETMDQTELKRDSRAAGQQQQGLGAAPPPPAEADPTAKPSDVARPRAADAPPQPNNVPPQDPPPETRQQAAEAGVASPPPPTPDAPNPDLAAKPASKANPSARPTKPGGAMQETERPREADHAPSLKAKLSGPEATRDQYLASVYKLATEHLRVLSREAIGGRQGVTTLGIQVLQNGNIAWITIDRSSGYPDIDRQVQQVIESIGRFPSLPEHFGAPSVHLVYSLRFPEGLP
jgi:protein TonB